MPISLALYSDRPCLLLAAKHIPQKWHMGRGGGGGKLLKVWSKVEAPFVS